MSAQRPAYSEDIFDDSRMTFGEHLDELRYRLLAAIKGLVFCLVIGFVLDGAGDMLGYPNFGVGKPVLRFITEPVETQVREFYRVRNEKAMEKLRLAWAEAQSVSKLRQPVPMPVKIPVAALADAFEGLKPKEGGVSEIDIVLQVYPGYFDSISKQGEYVLENRQYLTTLSVQEAFVVYFKVSLLCGVVLSCPWLFYQFWSFVGAGLYPHEKRLVHRLLPFSITLFLAGVFVCQFLVLPGAVKALLAFNGWIGLDPDLRLNEWLGFALIMPVVFGVSFQTPLVMMFLTRIGAVGWRDFLTKWRYAVMIIAVFSAVITPTPDAITMMYLFVPMFGLYIFGIGICYITPTPMREDDGVLDDESQVAV